MNYARSAAIRFAHIHLNMGYAYDQLGNERLANQYYGKFLQLTDGNPDFWHTKEAVGSPDPAKPVTHARLHKVNETQDSPSWAT